MRRLVALVVFALVASIPTFGTAQDVANGPTETEAAQQQDDQQEEQEPGEEGPAEEEEEDEPYGEDDPADDEEEADQDEAPTVEEMEVQFEEEEEENSATGFNFGIIGGVGLTNIASDDDDFGDAAGTEIGYSIGLQGSFMFNDIVGIVPQLMFSRRGWEAEGEAFGIDFSNDYWFSYLELPLLLQLRVPIGDLMAPKVMVGPHGALFLEGERTGSANNQFVEGEGEVDIDSEDVNNLQWGLTAAVGVDFNLGGGILTTDVRYVRNFTGVFEVDDDDDNVFHESWMLMLGFMY